MYIFEQFSLFISFCMKQIKFYLKYRQWPKHQLEREIRENGNNEMKSVHDFYNSYDILITTYQ